VFTTLIVDPVSLVRVCQDVNAGHVHGTVPCSNPAAVHCRRSGTDVCERHESGHAARTNCGQGEHEVIPVLEVGGARR
jgi:hypothetical protein